MIHAVISASDGLPVPVHEAHVYMFTTMNRINTRDQFVNYSQIGT
jgi:hypothetical protein